jgi:hypothetical protein
VRAVSKEPRQPLLGEWNRIGPGDADDIEAMSTGRSDKVGLERGGIGQKSRLA